MQHLIPLLQSRRWGPLPGGTFFQRQAPGESGERTTCLLRAAGALDRRKPLCVPSNRRSAARNLIRAICEFLRTASRVSIRLLTWIRISPAISRTERLIPSLSRARAHSYIGGEARAEPWDKVSMPRPSSAHCRSGRWTAPACERNPSRRRSSHSPGLPSVP